MTGKNNVEEKRQEARQEDGEEKGNREMVHAN